MNLPTGLALVLLGGLIPESAQFLLARGRKEEARQVMAKFGAMARATRPDEIVELARSKATALTGHAFFGKLLALSLAAICYSLVNFGLLLWLPADLVAKGYSMELTGTLLAESALIALPTIFVTAYAYSRWSTKWSVAGAIAVTIAGLGLVPRPSSFRPPRRSRSCCGTARRPAAATCATSSPMAARTPPPGSSAPLRQPPNLNVASTP
jgi:putative MFS transporter